MKGRGVCATSETLNETLEKMVVALYVPPTFGSPGVFPPLSVDTPDLTPGGTLEVQVDAQTTGSSRLYPRYAWWWSASWQAKAGSIMSAPARLSH